MAHDTTGRGARRGPWAAAGRSCPTRATPPRGASATGGAGRASTLWILRIVVLALAVRVFTAGIAFYANVVVPPFPRVQFTISGTTDKFWDTFERWDSGG